MRRVALTALVVLAGAAGPATASAAATPLQSADGITVTSQKSLDSRLLALTVTTKTLPKPANIRILLPTGYAQHPHQRYPVLYLLHGTSGGAADWTTMGGAEQTTAGKPLIVVMPDIAIDDDGGGWCTNWPDGMYSWETFHIDQLIPFIDGNLRTLTTRGERAIAGLSQGGFCSMSYAAQYPNLFGVALAYSGAPDIAWDPVAHAGAEAIINATEVGLDGVPPDSMFGNPVSDFLNWADHDPATLAPNLRWTKLYMYFGNGLPGPHDTAPNPEAEGIEGAIYTDNIYFHNRLKSLGITPAVYDYYGNGTHSWPYWARDLRWSIGDIMADFASPAPVPSSFSFMSAASSYSIYGWSIAIHRIASEFSTLTTTGTSAFTLAGSGSATVTTPPSFERKATYKVTLHTQSGTVKTQTVKAGASRTLSIDVPLGPSDSVQEWSTTEPPAPSTGTTVYTTHATITLVKAPAKPRKRRHKHR